MTKDFFAFKIQHDETIKVITLLTITIQLCTTLDIKLLEMAENGYNASVSLLSRNQHEPFLDRSEKPKSIAKPKIDQRKIMLCIWWDIQGIRYYEKTSILSNTKGVFLQYDNARPHVASMTQKKIRELNWEILCHPPYSPTWHCQIIIYIVICKIF
ncbi:histone-lysine N-methyltransferase SETMAR-like protein, partial [Leptotrombidium deliense]